MGFHGCSLGFWRTSCGLYGGAGRVNSVLRITIQKSTQEVTMKLEGRIAGPWVEELHRTWISLAPSLGPNHLRVDLCDVTFVDTKGKQALTEIRRCGAAFLADTAMTKSLVKEIDASL
jgi:hypothetical protein